jgi:hypothetical protein
MSLRRRIEKVAQEATGFSSTARLKDGTTVVIPHEDRLKALLCLIDDGDEVRPHPLHDVLKRLAPREQQADPSICDFASILQALVPAVREELEGEP